MRLGTGQGRIDNLRGPAGDTEGTLNNINIMIYPL
jgi:hypothetical protein